MTDVACSCMILVLPTLPIPNTSIFGLTVQIILRIFSLIFFNNVGLTSLCFCFFFCWTSYAILPHLPVQGMEALQTAGHEIWWVSRTLIFIQSGWIISFLRRRCCYCSVFQFLTVQVSNSFLIKVLEKHSDWIFGGMHRSIHTNTKQITAQNSAAAFRHVKYLTMKYVCKTAQLSFLTCINMLFLLEEVEIRCWYFPLLFFSVGMADVKALKFICEQKVLN